MDRKAEKIMARLEVYRNGQLLSTIEDEALFPDEKTILNMKAAGCRVLLDGKVWKGSKARKKEAERCRENRKENA
jgi:hypothetical protein